MTNLNLAFAYSELSNYVQCPQPAHMLVAQHVLRYLRGTYELGIRYHRDAFHPDQLWGWVDADWAGDIETRRSHWLRSYVKRWTYLLEIPQTGFGGSLHLRS